MNQLDKYFTFKCRKGLQVRLAKLPYTVDNKSYKDRLEYEINTIIQMGYPGYFLVVQDFINWAKKNNILVGDGRGSGAGSLCAFALGITNVDPIKYDLYFERFLNPARVSMPDFDIDFQKDRRDEVIQYVKTKYGADKVAQIGTFGTFKAKKSIKDVARTLGYSLTMANTLCKLYPKAVHGKEVTMKEAFQKVEKLAMLRASDTDEGRVLRWAEKIEGRVASFGIHASGVVISNEALTKVVPLAKGKNDEVVTQWDMNNIEEIGLIKFDFLGLKTLSQISTTLQLIKKNHGKDIDLTDISFDDPEVYINLRKGDNIGIFQLEASSGIRDLMIKIRPNTIEDLAAIVAMYRPGPLGSEQMEIYLKWRAGEGEPSFHHKDLKPILGETAGWLVYQEQVLRIARDMAGYTLAEADLLRRAVGKKKEKEMAEQKNKFFSGFNKFGYSTDLAEKLWEEIKVFADYGFNKSHAVGYAITAYKTAWLKTHYPVEFMAAALTCDSGNQDQMIVYIQECKRLGIPVLPPDVNESDLNFTPYNGTIRFGLSAIKNVGEAANHIIEERNNRGLFKSFFEFSERVNLTVVNKRKLESLVSSGAFDFTHQNRATLLLACEQVVDYRDEVKKFLSKLETYEKKIDACNQREKDIQAGVLSDIGKPLKLLKAPERPTSPTKPEYIVVAEMPLTEILQLEKDLTGSFISGHPLNGLTKKNTWTIQQLRESLERPEYANLLVIISDIQLKETKDKKRMAFLKFEDLTGTIEGAIFPANYTKHIDVLVKNIPVLLGAKIDYIDVETEEGDLVPLPSLLVQGIELAISSIPVLKETILDVNLDFDNVINLSKSIDKIGSGIEQVRLKFITKNNTALSPNNLIGISNERAFRALYYKNRK
jgi:DNA polymerase III subunit alpha